MARAGQGPDRAVAAWLSPCHNPAELQSALERLSRVIVRCRACPRLVAHREAVAASPPRRYAGLAYWARPLPGFGDPKARLLLVGGLGRIGWQAYLRARRRLGAPRPRRAPRFAHGAVATFADGVALIASYHPSQQNTFTGKLTRPMLRGVFRRARRLLEERS